MFRGTNYKSYHWHATVWSHQLSSPSVARLPLSQRTISRLPTVFSRHWPWWPTKHLSTLPSTAACYQTRTNTNFALLILELVSPPPERPRNSVTEVFHVLVLMFGTVYHLHSELRTWRFKRVLKTYLFTFV